MGTLPEKPPTGAVMSPKTRGLAAKAGFNLFFFISLLLCPCNAFPGPRFANSYRRYQEPQEGLDLDLLVPDYSQQQIEGIEEMLDQDGEGQPIELPVGSSWSSPEYQDYLDILPLLAAQPRISPFHKKDSEYLAFQADPSLTNRNLPENPSIALRKTPAPSATASPPTQPPPQSSLSAERRGMKEQALFRPEAPGPLIRGRKKRSTGQLNKISTPFLPSSLQ